MKQFLVSLVGALLMAAAPLSLAQVEWKDSSPHVAKLVTVDEGVQLEVLDWGGSGSPLVLLAGLGDTAHVFDDFAPALTARHHVLGITRRAHGHSSAPPTGYELARLAEDIVRVMDAVGLENPVIVGHSFAGEEMHVLGAQYSPRVSGLVYLDAAFNRGDHADTAAYNAIARTLPNAPGPAPSDLASFTALRAFLVRIEGSAGPEAHLRARFATNADGSVGGSWAPDLPIRQALLKTMSALTKAYNPEPIRVPALAVYAVPQSADDLMRNGSSDRTLFPQEFIATTANDPALREQVEKLYQLTRTRVSDHEQWFKKFAPQGRVAEISGPHRLFLSSPSKVAQQIEAFVSSLPQSR